MKKLSILLFTALMLSACAIPSEDLSNSSSSFTSGSSTTSTSESSSSSSESSGNESSSSSSESSSSSSSSSSESRTGIFFKDSKMAVIKGKTKAIEYESYGLSSAINWKSSDERVATVSSSGVVTAMSLGWEHSNDESEYEHIIPVDHVAIITASSDSYSAEIKVTTYFDYDAEHYSFQDNRDIDQPRPVANGVTRGDSISPYIPHYASYYLRPNHTFWMFFTFSGSTKAKLTDFNIVFGTRNDNAEGKIDVLQESFIYSSISGKNALLLEVEVSAAKEYYVRVDNDGDINKVPYHLYAFWF